MRNGFPPGFWGPGSPGDPDLDALLPEEAVDPFLDGAVHGVPGALGPLADTLAALRAAPSAAELTGEERALAAFRALHGSTGRNDHRARTLELEVLRDHAGNRQRARHRARPAGETRPGSHRGARGSRKRPSVGKRLTLALSTTAAAIVAIGAFAYAGRLPGPMQNVAHAIGAPAKSVTGPRSSASPSGVGSLNASATRIPQPTTSGPSATTTGEPSGPAQWCLAYFQGPWLPGAKSGDRRDDWLKLTEAFHSRNPLKVWQDCQPYLPDSAGGTHDPAPTPPDVTATAGSTGQASNANSGTSSGSTSQGNTGQGSSDKPATRSAFGHS